MINTIAALQGLYVALGGDIGDVANINTIPDMLEAVASVAGGAGGALPAVTSEDNGDILGVVEGAWSKRDPELPAVNGDDNGKILGVNNGAWDAVAAPLPTVAAADIGEALIVESDGEGGAQWGKGVIEKGVIYYDGTFTTSTTFTLSNDKKVSDVLGDINNGKNVILRNITGNEVKSLYYYNGLTTVVDATHFYLNFTQTKVAYNASATSNMDLLTNILYASKESTLNTFTLKTFTVSTT